MINQQVWMLNKLVIHVTIEYDKSTSMDVNIKLVIMSP